MNKDLENFNKFRYNSKLFTTNKYTEQNGKFVISDSFEINLYKSRIKSIEFCWINGMWEITNISYFQYQTDPKEPKIAGLISLASENDVLKNEMTDDNSAITPKNLQKRTANENRIGLARLASFNEVVDGKNNNSIVTPKTLKDILDKRITTTFENKTNYKNIDESELGYFFKFISGKEEIKKYDIPMINFKTITFDEKYIYHTDEEPIYGEYLYESFKSKNKHIEKLYCDNKMWIRESINEHTIGWVINYSYHHKPTTDEINAIDKDELIIGKIQVQDYLDILVDGKNRLRIHPDSKNQKVSFSWLEDYEDD